MTAAEGHKVEADRTLAIILLGNCRLIVALLSSVHQSPQRHGIRMTIWFAFDVTVAQDAEDWVSHEGQVGFRSWPAAGPISRELLLSMLAKELFAIIPVEKRDMSIGFLLGFVAVVILDGERLHEGFQLRPEAAISEVARDIVHEHLHDDAV